MYYLLEVIKKKVYIHAPNAALPKCDEGEWQTTNADHTLR
jgi:hypothetical protein